MEQVISATQLNKSYGQFQALNNLSMDIGKGQIVGLIGPNGAGKTTALRCLLGLSTYEGSLRVLGRNPQRERMALLKDVAYIADTAVLPKWISTEQVLEYMAGVHPSFDRQKAERFLAGTDIGMRQTVKQMSKGMVTQLHLAVSIAIDAKLLVLDEPTLGLDILYRKKFYQQLLGDFFDEQRTILITTHQVEEIEHLLTDLIFLKRGQITLNMDMDTFAATYAEVEVSKEMLMQARALNPILEQAKLGGASMLFENRSHDQLATLGRVGRASVADLFVAKMS